jgi:hypothetical protein
MELDRTFNPAYGSGQTLSVTATSQQVTFGRRSRAVTLSNLGSSVAYVRIATEGAATATTADYPVLPNTQVSISKGEDSSVLAAVCAATQTTTLHIIAGEGI